MQFTRIPTDNQMYRDVAPTRPRVLYQHFAQSHIADDTSTSASNYLPDASTNAASSHMHNDIDNDPSLHLVRPDGNTDASTPMPSFDALQQMLSDPYIAPFDTIFPANLANQNYQASRAPHFYSPHLDSPDYEASLRTPPSSNSIGLLPTTNISSASFTVPPWESETYSNVETLNDHQTHRQGPSGQSISTQGGQHNARPRAREVLLCPIQGCNRQYKEFSRSDNRLNHLRGVHGIVILKRKGRRPNTQAVGNFADSWQASIQSGLSPPSNPSVSEDPALNFQQQHITLYSELATGVPPGFTSPHQAHHGQLVSQLFPGRTLMPIQGFLPTPWIRDHQAYAIDTQLPESEFESVASEVTFSRSTPTAFTSTIIQPIKSPARASHEQICQPQAVNVIINPTSTLELEPTREVSDGNSHQTLAEFQPPSTSAGGLRRTPSTSTPGSSSSRSVQRYRCNHEGCNQDNINGEWKYNDHLKSHTTYRPFKCRNPGCLSAFKRERDRKKHEVEKHPIESLLEIPAAPDYQLLPQHLQQPSEFPYDYESQFHQSWDYI
ncbi:hypothetical protein DFH27DRAFT_277577 [Peziza echinospora]|nr:hypothetical protein DFH27DRAFT_277577 [Peziza echinospora]